MKYIYRYFLEKLLRKIFGSLRFSNPKELAEWITLVKCDSVYIEGITDYYNTLNPVGKNIANIMFRLFLAYLLNRCGIKVEYNKIYNKNI